MPPPAPAPAVSIVIPTHDRLDTLPEVLDRPRHPAHPHPLRDPRRRRRLHRRHPRLPRRPPEDRPPSPHRPHPTEPRPRRRQKRRRRRRHRAARGLSGGRHRPLAGMVGGPPRGPRSSAETTPVRPPSRLHRLASPDAAHPLPALRQRARPAVRLRADRRSRTRCRSTSSTRPTCRCPRGCCATSRSTSNSLIPPGRTSRPATAWRSAVMRLVYEARAVTAHDHPTTIGRFARRQEKAGYSAVVFQRLHPELGAFLGVGPGGPPPLPSRCARRLREIVVRGFAKSTGEPPPSLGGGSEVSLHPRPAPRLAGARRRSGGCDREGQERNPT